MLDEFAALFSPGASGQTSDPDAQIRKTKCDMLRKLVSCLVSFTPLAFFPAFSAEDGGSGAVVRATVDAARVEGRVDVGIYGHFLEHIYHSVQGGLWGQMVLNGSLEVYNKELGLRYWELSGGAGVIAEQPLNGRECVRMRQDGSGEAGLRQRRVTGARKGANTAIMAFEAGMRYKGSLHLRGTGSVEVAILGEGDKPLGSATFTDPGGEWRKFEFEFTAAETVPEGGFRILLKGPGQVDVDLVQMFSQAALDLGGLRPDLHAAVAALKPATMRWPGGCFASRYDWKNGLGPREERKPNGSRLWADQDYGEFGINEFLGLCRRLQCEPILVVNFQLGLGSALDLLEYCLGGADTKWGAERIRNGIADPVPLRWLELDNETWGMGVPAYAVKVKEYSAAIRARYPGIKLVACGSNSYKQEWNRDLIAACAENFDVISVHHYTTSAGDYHLTDAAKYEAFLVELGKIIKGSSNPGMTIYVSEWNPTMVHSWKCGLYTGALLNAFERQGDMVRMSCPALFLRRTWAPRWDNALINHDQRSWFPAQNYVVMKMYREHHAPLRLHVDGGEGLNLVAAKTDDGKTIQVKLVQPLKEARAVEIVLAGGFQPRRASVRMVSAPDLNAHNTIEQPDRVRESAGEAMIEGPVVRVVLPPYSVAVVTIQ